MKRLLLILIMAGLAGCAAGGRDLPPLETVERVDLDRFMGRWYVIANIPYFGERDAVDSRAIYRPRDDGRMDDIFVYRDGTFDAPLEEREGVAWVVDETTNARWKVRFIWPFTFDYYILELDAEYQWVVVGHPSRDLAWIMARDKRLDESLYAELLGRLAGHGYDPQALEKVPQFPRQVGAPGFQ